VILNCNPAAVGSLYHTVIIYISGKSNEAGTVIYVAQVKIENSVLE
jgi:hypothetical protein